MYSLKEHAAECDQIRKAIPHGPWTTEADWLDFYHHGIRCIAKRVPIHFAWVGYIGIESMHPWFQTKDYSDLDSVVSIHGGITYLGDFPIDEAVDENPTLWLGFDCAHCNDFCPGFMRYFNGFIPDQIYRDEQYVVRELKHLAFQARKAWRLSHWGKKAK